MKEQFAEIILPLPLYDRFTYRIPDDLCEKVKPGVRVLVQFGKRKNYSALVIALTHIAPEGFEIKPILSVLDDNAVIHPVNLGLWNWMADYYMSPLGEVMNAAMPSALKLQGSDGLVEEKYKEKTKTTIGIRPDLRASETWETVLDSLSKAPKQKDLLYHFVEMSGMFSGKNKTTIDKQQLLKGSGIGEGVLNQLVDKGFLTIHKEVVSRVDTPQAEQADMNLLNNWQQEAIDQIREQFLQKQVVLIHGVTASGKTEIYIHLIDEACRQGKQVLYLVPEIALTPQIVVRLKKVFGKRVGVYHSKMNDAERVEIWNKVLQFSQGNSEGFQIILGARSAVFLPFARLGMIIVDEEHENSYKQYDPAPRYNARDMAVVLGIQHKAPVLLGSATPSFESYLNAQNGKYGLVKLSQRHGKAKMPQVIIADLQRAFKRRQMLSMLSPELYENMQLSLETGEQVILFQNRRGYSPFVECMECGWIPWCVNCDVSLTYHRKHERLSCHYCGHHIKLPPQCPKCQSAQLKTRGMGTEKIEDEISKLFPQARIARMDLDTTQSKTAFEKIIHQLETQKIDILVGTQMVTKGLDIEHVGLVGVLNADNLLNFPDFRAHERAFQLMMQVSGRSGRKEKEGKVVIQTSQPTHQVIQFLKNDDYEGFFRKHIVERKSFLYPPWFRMIKIIAKHKNPAVLDAAAMFLAMALRNMQKFIVLGPEYPLIGRVQQLYTKEIWLKIARNKKPDDIKSAVRDAVETTKRQPGNSSLILHVDVDPM
jgi:primosomal protein N' (replication factor Y) (superfamily II helicase)